MSPPWSSPFPSLGFPSQAFTSGLTFGKRVVRRITRIARYAGDGSPRPRRRKLPERGHRPSSGAAESLVPTLGVSCVWVHDRGVRQRPPPVVRPLARALPALSEPDFVAVSRGRSGDGRVVRARVLAFRCERGLGPGARVAGGV